MARHRPANCCDDAHRALCRLRLRSFELEVGNERHKRLDAQRDRQVAAAPQVEIFDAIEKEAIVLIDLTR